MFLVCLPKGFPVTEEQLEEAATYSGVLEVPDDYLPVDVHAECECIIPDVNTIKPEECKDAYLYLKQNYQL